MRYSIYNHCDGIEKISKIFQEEITAAIQSIKIQVNKGSGSRIRDALSCALTIYGWSKKVSIAKDSEMTITSVKSKIGMCLQTGNMARLYADLLKLQKLYMDNAITAGVIIVPSKRMAKIIGDNIAHDTRLERELEIFKKVIFIPLLLFAIE